MIDQMQTTPEERQRVEDAAKKATPGEWSHYRDKLRPNFGGIINEVQCDERTAIVRWGGFDDSERPERKHAANAAHIAACNPDFILRLLSDLRTLQARLTEAYRAFEKNEIGGVLLSDKDADLIKNVRKLAAQSRQQAEARTEQEDRR